MATSSLLAEGPSRGLRRFWGDDSAGRTLAHRGGHWPASTPPSAKVALGAIGQNIGPWVAPNEAIASRLKLERKRAPVSGELDAANGHPEDPRRFGRADQLSRCRYVERWALALTAVWMLVRTATSSSELLPNVCSSSHSRRTCGQHAPPTSQPRDSGLARGRQVAGGDDQTVDLVIKPRRWKLLQLGLKRRIA
jgi:hypothetical protein